MVVTGQIFAFWVHLLFCMFILRQWLQRVRFTFYVFVVCSWVGWHCDVHS